MGCDFRNCTDLKWPRLRTDANGEFEFNELEDDTRLTVYTPQQFAPIEDLEVELDGQETEVTIKMQAAAELRVRAVDEETGEPIPAFNVKLGRCKGPNVLAGDVESGGIEVSLSNPGTNVHGSTKEFVLAGQEPGIVYSLTVSAEGYETVEVPRIRADVKPETTDVELKRK